MSDNANANANAAAAASNDEATIAADIIQVTASILLQDFYNSNSPQDVASSGKILITLLRNAVSSSSSSSTASNPKHGTIRLSNPKIQKHIVNVYGALDILERAGFVRASASAATGDMTYVPPSAAGDRDLFSLRQHEERRDFVAALCAGLEAKITERTPAPAPAAAPVSTAGHARKSASSHDNADFLGDEERLARIRQLKAQKRAKKAEREVAKDRWNEDVEKRKLAAQRREASFTPRVNQVERNIRLSETGEDLEASRSKSRLLGQDRTADSDPEATRRRLIQKAVKDPELTPQEKQSKIQELMRMDPEAVILSAADDRFDAGAEQRGVARATKTMDTKQSSKNSSDGGDQEDARKPDRRHDARTSPARKAPPSQPSSNDSAVLPTRLPTPASDAWTLFTTRTPRCAAAEGIRDSSVYYQRDAAGSASGVPRCLKRLFREFDGLERDLPSDPHCSIWLRFDEETPQYIRALVTAPLPGPTPYSGGIFAFDMYIPHDYPRTHPKMQLLTTGGGRVRFGPNLYADGKVCLSLLGTWDGPKWNPQHSSLHQLLISVQGLVLGVEHPFYLEPGHGGWEGTVKEGDFQCKARTLAGREVHCEVGVPPHVVQYEDGVRLATVKYAMAQPLRRALEKKKPHGDDGLEAFGDVVRAHFYENRTAIVFEIRGWMDDLALGRTREASATLGRDQTPKKGAVVASQMDKLVVLLPTLEELLARAAIPESGGKAASGVASMDVDEDSKPPAQVTKRVEKQQPTPNSKQSPSSNDTDALEQKRQLMQSSAERGDYVLAGKLQEEVMRLEELQLNMQSAAQQNDFIRAGHLQAQFKALTENTTQMTALNSSVSQRSSSAWNEGANDDWSDDDDHGAHGMDLSDDDMDEDEDGPPFPHHFGLGSNHMPAPPNYKSHTTSRFHSWGTGHALAAPKKSPPTAESNTKKTATEAPPQINPDQLCRLRIRLPQDKSVVEDFDKDDTLAEVYRRLDSLVPDDSIRTKKGAAAAAGPRVPGGAFAQPLSMAGFTLLLTLPKREFNLEMHGTRSLAELHLAPSATLTVMKCSERGVMYRGEVESRLRAAQGDAMDVDGLTYEGLTELTERVGRAGPKEGCMFLTMTTEEFEANTEKISPSSYLAALEKATGEHGTEDCRCPICLGSYDKLDTTLSLRTIKNCEHTMHAGCLTTWLKTNSSCPLCKMNIVADCKAGTM